MNSAYIFGFLYEVIIFNIICDNSHIKDNTFTAQLCTGNILGTFQVNDVTVILQIVKFTSPVRSNDKNINVIFDNIVNFLTLVFLNNDLICQSCPSDIFNSFDQTVSDVQLPTFNIVALTGNADNEIISKGFCPFNNIIMTLMKQIKSAIRDYFFHVFPLYLPCICCVFAITFYLYYTFSFGNYNINQDTRHQNVTEILNFSITAIYT